jgi:hypothetical protein
LNAQLGHDAEHAGPRLDPRRVTLPRGGWWGRLPLVGGIAGVALLLATFLVGGSDHPQLFHSYLLSWLFFVTIALGGLFFVLLQHLTRAGWSVVVRRLAEACAATLPVLALLGVPLAFGLHDLYHWSHAEAVAHDPLLQHKSAWLDPTFFLVRSAVYLLVWSALAWWFRRQSQRQDEMGAVALTRRMQSASAPAMLLFGVTLTLASFDWIMSLAPHWYSTVFGVYIFAGVAISAFATLILLAVLLERGGQLSGVVSAEHFHDLGKLLFGFVVFWAYIAFSQFMLIWYANMPEETVWFAARWTAEWKPVSVALALVHFAVPFFFLLLRDLKRHRLALAAAAVWMLAVHWLDLYWLVMPGHYTSGPRLHLLGALSLLAIGATFVAALAWALRNRALVPVADPRLPESLSFENV